MILDYCATLGRAGAHFPDLKDTAAVTAHYHQLAATDHKTDKDTGADALRASWQKDVLHQPDRPRLQLQAWDLLQFFETTWAAPAIDLASLPDVSFAVAFTFTLAQPYLSKDDAPFYIIDNPIVRDKVFRLPMMRPSSWKGSLRHALWQLGYPHDGQEYLDERSRRLCGESLDDEHGQSGRLIFYPTFFTQSSLEIINPHDRTRRVGKNPILLESVPQDACGTFTLLYIPYDRVGQADAGTRAQVATDLRLLAAGLQAMFTVFGFGAKTSSGFGLAQESVRDGVLTLRASGLQAASAPEPAAAAPVESLPRYLAAPDRLRPEYLTADGSFQEASAAELKAKTKTDRQLYVKAKAWWEREGRDLAAGKPTLEPAAPAVPPSPTWPSWAFATFEELVSQADAAAQQLTKAGKP